MATARRKTATEKKAAFRKSVVRRQLANRDRPKSITGATDPRDDPDRLKKKRTRLDHGRRRVADKAQVIKKAPAAGSKIDPKKRGRR